MELKIQIKEGHVTEVLLYLIVLYTEKFIEVSDDCEGEDNSRLPAMIFVIFITSLPL